MNGTRALERSRNFWGFAWRRCAGCASSSGSAARCSRRPICVDAKRCSRKNGRNGCAGCCPSSQTPLWLSWALAWIAPFELPPSIYGFGNQVGGIKKTLFAAEQNRPDVAEKRARWHEQLAAEPVAPLVFVDESGAHTKMTRWRGRALGGKDWWRTSHRDTIRRARC